MSAWITFLCVPPTHKASSAVEPGSCSGCRLRLCDCPIALFVPFPAWSSACLCNASREDTPVKPLSGSAAGRPCALKQICSCLFQVFTFCGCLKFFPIVKYVLFRCRWISFVRCSTKLTWIMSSLFLKISHSQSYLRCLCMCFIVAETDQYQGSLEDLPFRVLSIYYNQILNANFSTFYLLGFFQA